MACLAVQPDGKLLVGGDFREFAGFAVSGLVRLNTDGSRDPSFAPAFTFPTEGAILAVRVLADGNILVAGYFTDAGGSGRKHLARLKPDGAVDTSFDARLDANAAVFSILPMPDGTLILGGIYVDGRNQVRLRMLKLNATGTAVSGFNPEFLDGTFISEILRAPDGQLVVAGDFRPYGIAANHLAKVSADGVFSDTFLPPVGLSTGISSVQVLPDGALVIAGEFGGDASSSGRAVRRLLASGADDSTFVASLAKNGATPWVNAVLVQADGRVIVGGSFDSVDGVGRSNLARLEPDGRLDRRFAADAQADGEVIALVSAGGSLYVGGAFSHIGGATRKGVARLRVPQLPPFILIQPSGRTITAGGNIELTVKTAGSVGETYQWLLEGVEIPGATSPTLSRFDVRVGGNYAVRVSNPAGAVTSQVAAITVQPRNAGSRDLGFAAAVPVTDRSYPATVIPLPDGRIYVINRGVQPGIRVLRADGSLDSQLSFGVPATPPSVEGGVGLADGSVYLFGGFQDNFGAGRGALAKLKPNGTVDTTFTPALEITRVSALATTNEGLYVAGEAKLNGRVLPLVRLSATGALDAGFDFRPPYRTVGISQLFSRPDGTIYVYGDIADANGGIQGRILRIKADGSVDAAFDAWPIRGTRLLGVSTTGVVYVYSNEYSAVCRLNASGAIEPGFRVIVERTEYRRGGERRFAFPAAPKQLLPLPGGAMLLYTTDEVNGAPVSGPMRISPDGAITPVSVVDLNQLVAPWFVDDLHDGWLVLDLGQEATANAGSPGMMRAFKAGLGDSRLVNLSARAFVGAGERVLITGFVTAGAGSRTLLLRGVGPALRALGVQEALAEPKLELFRGSSRLAVNAGWQETQGAEIEAAAQRLGAFALDPASRDAALRQTLPAGVYTALVGSATGDGVALVETYDDAGPHDRATRLVNLSARGYVEAGERVLIAGLVVAGTGTKQLLIRGVGPSLRPLGVQAPLANPRLRVFQRSTCILENDDWATQWNSDQVRAAAQAVGPLRCRRDRKTRRF